MRAKLAVLAAVVLFGAACGGDSGLSIGSDGTVRNGDAEEFCAFLESDTDALEEQFGGSFDDDMGAFRDAISALRDSAPDEIGDDMDVLFDVTVTLVEAFDDIEEDDPAALGRMMEVVAELEPRSAEIEAASANVQDWAVANCDLPDDFTVFESGGADDPFGSGANAYGDDPELDALWDQCAGGDLAACDSLWFDAPFGSEYESFGDTCGGTRPSSSGGCEFASQFGTDDGFDVDLPQSYGDDADLDALWDDCGAGNLSACDSLYYSSPVDSDYERFAQSCGGTSTEEQFGTCVAGPEGDASNYGDDPFLDQLYDDCAAGDLGACDSLYFSSPIDSDYEVFGQSCGGTSSGPPGTCGGGGADGNEPFGYGDDVELDTLWDGCAAGDNAACDVLWWDSPIGSEYETFAESCGGRSSEPLLGDCEAEL